jgi:dipeptidyl aminopeptidase/acylaminoacyl peptidase
MPRHHTFPRQEALLIRSRSTLLCAAVCAASMVVPALSAAPPPLIPRELLFGNPERLEPRISPDGRRLAYVAPDEGVLNVWVRTIGKNDDRVVTRDRERGIRIQFWAPDSERLLYIQDKDGDENWHLYGVDLKTLETRDLTPFPGVQARVVAIEPSIPGEILVGINDRNPEVHDVHRLDLKTGKLTLEVRNDQGFAGYLADHALKVRAATRATPEGGVELHVRDTAEAPWRVRASWSREDALTSEPHSFTPDNRGLYVVSSAGTDTSELRELDLAGQGEKVLARDAEVDVDGVVLHPVKHTVQAVRFNKERVAWTVLDPAVGEDFAAIGRAQRGDFDLIGRDLADATWLVRFITDDGPVRYYSYDRRERRADLLFSARPALEKVTLAQMKPVRLEARDGLPLRGYLTLPPGSEGKGLPLVLLVHGGPWHRDSWGYEPEAQWLANRGYAVLQINFRGSTGYGKAFINAGDREWGGKMQDDLTDAVRWAIQEKLADPGRVAIMGGSYGGYATLAGMAFTPDLFACGVDIVGPSNLLTLLNSIPPYWKPIQSLFHARVGHPQKDAEFLKSRSPLTLAERIEKPLLIGQGANDPRVKKAESLQIVEALKKKNKPVEYVEYADEGHGFARPENRLDFYSKAESFLARHLGGRQEPLEP